MKRWEQIQQSTGKPLKFDILPHASLMFHEKDLFLYITNYIMNEILKWALQTAHLSQKWAATTFSTSNPFLLIVHENDQFWYMTANMEYEIFKWAPETTQLSSNEPVIFFPHFGPILFIVQSNYQFWCATLWTLMKFSNELPNLLN